jgi:hypothetical protein
MALLSLHPPHSACLRSLLVSRHVLAGDRTARTASHVAAVAGSQAAVPYCVLVSAATTPAPAGAPLPVRTLLPARRRGRPSLRPTAVDLFCGPGGLSRGLVEAGFRVVAAAELEPLAADTYRDNFPNTMLWHGDLRALASCTSPATPCAMASNWPGGR